MENFKIATLDKSGEVEIKIVSGERIMINEVPCFIFQEEPDLDGDQWNISHLETGMKVSKGYKRDTTILIAKERIGAYPEAIEKGEKICESYGIKLPLNI